LKKAHLARWGDPFRGWGGDPSLGRPPCSGGYGVRGSGGGGSPLFGCVPDCFGSLRGPIVPPVLVETLASAMFGPRCIRQLAPYVGIRTLPPPSGLMPTQLWPKWSIFLNAKAAHRVWAARRA